MLFTPDNQWQIHTTRSVFWSRKQNDDTLTFDRVLNIYTAIILYYLDVVEISDLYVDKHKVLYLNIQIWLINIKLWSQESTYRPHTMDLRVFGKGWMNCRTTENGHCCTNREKTGRQRYGHTAMAWAHNLLDFLIHFLKFLMLPWLQYALK